MGTEHFWTFRCRFAWRQKGAKREGLVAVSKTMAERGSAKHWDEAVSSALNFPFLKEVSQNGFFLMLSTSTIEDVSQNSFACDFVKFKN